jgi:hypothetical protein
VHCKARDSLLILCPARPPTRRIPGCQHTTSDETFAVANPGRWGDRPSRRHRSSRASRWWSSSSGPCARARSSVARLKTLNAARVIAITKAPAPRQPHPAGVAVRSGTSGAGLARWREPSSCVLLGLTGFSTCQPPRRPGCRQCPFGPPSSGVGTAPGVRGCSRRTEGQICDGILPSLGDGSKLHVGGASCPPAREPHPYTDGTTRDSARPRNAPAPPSGRAWALQWRSASIHPLPSCAMSGLFVALPSQAENDRASRTSRVSVTSVFLRQEPDGWPAGRWALVSRQSLRRL